MAWIIKMRNPFLAQKAGVDAMYLKSISRDSQGKFLIDSISHQEDAKVFTRKGPYLERLKELAAVTHWEYEIINIDSGVDAEPERPM